MNNKNIVIFRLAKDLECYMKEKMSEESKICEMREQNADIYDIRQLVSFYKVIFINRKQY